MSHNLKVIRSLKFEWSQKLVHESQCDIFEIDEKYIRIRIYFAYYSDVIDEVTIMSHISFDSS